MQDSILLGFEDGVRYFEALFIFHTFSIVYYKFEALRSRSCSIYHPQVQTELVERVERATLIH
jgi:hypothetical protein